MPNTRGYESTSGGAGCDGDLNIEFKQLRFYAYKPFFDQLIGNNTLLAASAAKALEQQSRLLHLPMLSLSEADDLSTDSKLFLFRYGSLSSYCPIPR
jgi:hypothetical protein